VEDNNQLLKSASKIEAHEEKPSPIYWSQQYEKEPPLLKNFGFEEKVLAILSQLEDSNQLLQPITNKETLEEEPSPIYWPQQYKEKPYLLSVSDLKDKMLNLMRENNHMVNSQ
jgi:hypothetical protein